MSENEKLVVVDDDYYCLTVEKYVDMGMTFFHISTLDKQSGFIFFKTVDRVLALDAMKDFLDHDDVKEFVNEVV